MRFRFGHLLGVLLVFFITAQLIAAPDRTIAEFKEYVVDKMDGLLTESELDAYAKRVDQDGDGTISDEEFKERHSILRALLAEPEEEAEDAGEEDKPKDTPETPAEEAADEEVDKPSRTPRAPLTNSTDATVLLITADELAEAWQPFAKWKTQNGKVTKIVTVQEIADDFEADSIQEKIRLCVRQHIDNHSTQWVVLGGDCLPNGEGLVPGGHTTVHRRERKGIPTDIVYLSPTNWDADEDGIYGEFDDDQEAISYPDGSIGLGRIPVRTKDDVKAFTDKVIEYESSYPETEFARNMIYTCTEKGAYPKVRNSWDDYLSKVWDGEMGRFFAAETPWDEEDEPGSYPLNAENVVQLFNDKTTSKLHIHGHGFLPAWVLEKRSKLDSKELGKLENKGAYPLITTVSCFTGQFDSKTDPSIVEEILRLPGAGSVAVVAPVRTGKPHFAKRSDMRLMITEGKLDGTTMCMTNYWTFGLSEGCSTGHAMMRAKDAIGSEAKESSAIHLCICELNLLGDPTLDMRAQTPATPSVEIKSKSVKAGHEITVSTDAPGCQLCMWNGTEEYQVATADDKGKVVAILKSSPADVTFTVSGANLNSVSQVGLSK